MEGRSHRAAPLFGQLVVREFLYVREGRKEEGEREKKRKGRKRKNMEIFQTGKFSGRKIKDNLCSW
jgi:hypothetical protein